MTARKNNQRLRILLAALGGEGGGVLMNWIVETARNAGYAVQATSVPGVAQRTGSTSYYIEIANAKRGDDVVFGLVPIPGRVDVVLSSELVETARVIAAGYVSPERTTLISSTARTYATAEKIALGDGRYTEENVSRAAAKMAWKNFLLDLGKIATDNGTFVSATMFGALAGSEVLPWDLDKSRVILETGGKHNPSLAGFDAAVDAIRTLHDAQNQITSKQASAPTDSTDKPNSDLPDLPKALQQVLQLGHDRCVDFQDEAYGEEYLGRAKSLYETADLDDSQISHAVTEACRRLALWMAYEDVARVADLKTRPERFDRIRQETKSRPGQIISVTEFMKPRAEELADILPVAIGERIMRRAANGRKFPFLGRGIHVRSNGVMGYWMLRGVASLSRLRRRSYRFKHEQIAIDEWLDMMKKSLVHSPAVAQALAELPRVLKGYSDTLQRGKSAYNQIMAQIVRPTANSGHWDKSATVLQSAIAAALADDTHARLDAVLSDQKGPTANKKSTTPALASEVSC
ncbi:MAG: indolepyruvate oxidoreductase subunit beta family protein [Pseudomonadota bacterium]